MPLIDSFQRRISYLRVSVTDRCNLRCQYCMPTEGVAASARQELLSYEEIYRIVACFVRLGVSHVRLTGGEPLVRKDLPQLVSMLASLPGLKDLSMTTNGLLLRQYASSVAAAGLKRLNISLDSLDPKRFEAITRGGRLDEVLAGIDRAIAVGLVPIKLNVVVMRGCNEDELLEFVKFAGARKLIIRFIECMPMADVGFSNRDRFVSMDEVKRNIEAIYPLEPVAVPGSGPAVYFRVRSTGAILGFISPLTPQFCEVCNRVRLTALGRLRLCLDHEDHLDLKTLLRAGITDEMLEAEISSAILRKPEKNRFLDHPQYVSVGVMSAIGG
jgi:GTP 3',8-cyclase